MRKSAVLLVGFMFLAGTALAADLTLITIGHGTTSPAGGTSDSPLVYSYAQGTVVSVQATPTPDTDHIFYGWTLDGDSYGDSSTLEVTMDQDHTLVAEFSSYLLVINPIQGEGTLQVLGPDSQPVMTVEPGTLALQPDSGADLKAVPATGWSFDHWVINSVSDSSNPITITVNEDMSLTAVFIQDGTYALRTAKTGQGTITPTAGVHRYSAGTAVTATATPTSPHVLDHWVFDGTSVDATSLQYPLQMSADHELKAVFTSFLVSFSVYGNGSISVDGASVPSILPVLADQTLQVTATAAAGYAFSRWLINGQDSGSVPSLEYAVSADATIRAEFISGATRTLALTTTGFGTVDPEPGTYTYDVGTVVHITATPAEGQVLDHWVVDGTAAGANATLDLSMTDNHTVQAVFSSYTLIVSSDSNGSVKIDGEAPALPYTAHVVAGTHKSLLAVPNSGYAFGHWRINDQEAGSANPLDLTVDATTTVEAIFVSDSERQLTIATAGQGTTDPTPGTYTYAQGTSVTVTASPAAGTAHVLDHWVVDGITLSGASLTITLTMNANHSVQAVFTSFLVTVAIEGQGMLTADGSLAVNGAILPFVAATQHVFNATASTGWVFDYWTFNGTNLGAETPLTMQAASTGTLTAVFVQAATIKGHVTFDGSPLSGVVMSGLPGSPVTNTLGYYSVTLALGWSGTVQPTRSGYTFTPPSVHYEDASGTITQDYTAALAETFPLTVTVRPANAGSVELDPADGPYPSGTTVELTPQPAAGYDFAYWQGALTGSETPASLVMDSAKSVTAVFVKEACAVTSITTVTPADGTIVHAGATALDTPLTLAVITDCGEDTSSVSFTLDNSWNGSTTSGTAAGLFSVAGPLFSRLAEGTHTLTVAATSQQHPAATIPSVTVTFTVARDDASVDANANGLPDIAFGTLLNDGDIWVESTVGDTGTNRLSGLVRWNGQNVKNVIGNAVVALTDPASPTHRISVVAPVGLLHANEIGILLVQAAPDLVSLLGAIESEIVGTEPAALLANASYIEASILVSQDGGAHFTEIDAARLAENPVHIAVEGASAGTAVNPTVYAYPTSVIADPLTGVRVIAWTGDWNQDEILQTTTGTSTIEADVTGLSVFAPVDEAENAPSIDVALSGGGNTYSFGVVAVDDSPETTVTVTNTGGGILAGKATVAAPFEVLSPVTYRLSAGQSQVMTVRFTPADAASYHAMVNFSGGGGGNLSLSGSAYTKDSGCNLGAGVLASPPPPGGDGLLLAACATVLLALGSHRVLLGRRSH